MNKHSALFFTILILSQNVLFCMEAQLMHRANAKNKQNNSPLSFDKRTVQDIKAEKCTLCYDKLANTGQEAVAILLSCGHAVHAPCYDALKKHRYHACPVCRKPIELDQKDEEKEPCCISVIHDAFDGCINSLEYHEKLLTLFVHDFTSQGVSWKKIRKKMGNTSVACLDANVM